MTIEFLVSLIVGVLGFIFKEVQANKELYETKLNDSRKAIDNGDAHLVLSDLHDRVQQEVRGS